MPYFKQGKYEVALEQLDQAVALSPKDWVDYRAFMKCIFVKSYKSAVEDFLEAKQQKGEYGYIMDHNYDFYLGVCYLQLNEFPKATATFEDRLAYARQKGENWVHYLDLFYADVAYFEQQQYEKAIHYFDASLRIYQNFSDAKYYKAIALARTANTQEADRLLTECEHDYKRGYTINEDNAKYEKYPYQINQELIDILKK